MLPGCLLFPHALTRSAAQYKPDNSKSMIFQSARCIGPAKGARHRWVGRSNRQCGTCRETSRPRDLRCCDYSFMRANVASSRSASGLPLVIAADFTGP